MTRQSITHALAAVWLSTFVPITVAWAGVQPQPFRTGLFGVTTGQSIRISILNAGEAGGVINPCVHVLDAEGKRLLERDNGPLSGGAGTCSDHGSCAHGSH